MNIHLLPNGLFRTAAIHRGLMTTSRRPNKNDARQREHGSSPVYRFIDKFSLRLGKLNNVVKNAKKRFYLAIFSTTKTCKKLFSLTDQLLGKTKHKLNGDKELCNKFSTFFDSKITKIREDLEFQQTNNPLRDPSFEGKKLEHFTAILEKLVEKTIRTFASKSCDLDPIPTDLLKKCVKNPCVLSYITSIFNQSLQSGAVPDEFKKALVNPMLKKPNLDETDSKNFRPVSNLPFLSKVLEKLVAQQLLAHLDKYGLKNRFQSAYRSNHSTETDLIKVSNAYGR
ncbi:reverse transcriptase-like protein [Elysia marginata]|uniref:Reverse transcriptase-like protein n=1 Tax=Elysia marginata TaxID=1093978 RepID=A0AAV4F767_9GAST|nr:reverse transcriptase-like protein [Elysia marginata]